MSIIDVLVWVPMLSLVAYIPLVCYLDLKKREVEHIYWLPLWVVNLPIVVFFYLEGYYPIYDLVYSAIPICVAGFMCAEKWIGGADFLYVTAISLFFVLNPYPIPHGSMAPIFLIFWGAALLVVWFFNQARRVVHGGMDYSVRVIPGMIPISAALIMTVVV